MLAPKPPPAANDNEPGRPRPPSAREEYEKHVALGILNNASLLLRKKGVSPATIAAAFIAYATVIAHNRIGSKEARALFQEALEECEDRELGVAGAGVFETEAA